MAGAPVWPIFVAKSHTDGCILACLYNRQPLRQTHKHTHTNLHLCPLFSLFLSLKIQTVIAVHSSPLFRGESASIAHGPHWSRRANAATAQAANHSIASGHADKQIIDTEIDWKACFSASTCASSHAYIQTRKLHLSFRVWCLQLSLQLWSGNVLLQC